MPCPVGCRVSVLIAIINFVCEIADSEPQVRRAQRDNLSQGFPQLIRRDPEVEMPREILVGFSVFIASQQNDVPDGKFKMRTGL